MVFARSPLRTALTVPLTLVGAWGDYGVARSQEESYGGAELKSTIETVETVNEDLPFQQAVQDLALGAIPTPPEASVVVLPEWSEAEALQRDEGQPGKPTAEKLEPEEFSSNRQPDELPFVPTGVDSRSLTPWQFQVPLQANGKTQIVGRYQWMPAEDEDWDFNTLADGQRLTSGTAWTEQVAVGLKQRWQPMPRLDVEMSYERIFGGVLQRKLPSLDSASGDKFVAALQYQLRPQWKTEVQLEHRTGQGDDYRTKALARLGGPITSDVKLQIQGQYRRESEQDPRSRVQIALNYAPAQKPVSGQLVYEYRDRDRHNENRAHLLKANAIYEPHWRWQVSSQLALHQSDQGHAVLGQAGLTHVFPNRLDLHGDLRWVQQSQHQGQRDNNSGLGATMEVGYHLNSSLRLSAGYAFGQTRYRLFQDAQSSGPYVNLSVK